MDASTDVKPKASISDYLAAERTFLAWIRTGLALMGFGFVVARFGLFLQEMQVVQRLPEPQSYGVSLWFGTALMVVGVVVNVAAGWRHVDLVRKLDRGDVALSPFSTRVVVLAFFLAVVGLAMAIYLISVGTSAHAPPRKSEEVSMRLES